MSQIDRAVALLEQGRTEDALKLTEPLAKGPNPSHQELATHSQILKVLKRHADALVFDQLAAERYGRSPVAWHNLGATLDDMGRAQEACAAMERGFALGLNAPESFRVYGRALMAANQHDRAEAAYKEAFGRQPANVELASEYANLVWMRRGDMSGAQHIMDFAFHSGAPPGGPILTKARLWEAAGERDKAADLLALAAQRLPQDVGVLLAAAHAQAERGEIADAERLVRSAQVLAPKSPGVLNQLTIVLLAAGKAEEALTAARKGLTISPDDQSLWGWAATAARAAGDPLYEALSNYEGNVAPYDIETPEGWPTLEAFLADLAVTLRRMHVYQQHPHNQSVRGGSQTMQMLVGSREPTLQALFKAVDAPIRAHIAKLGQGDDILRKRNTGDYRMAGAWSVLLRPGGFHTDHFHSQGWLSSAFYVETPTQALDRETREGWLRFGKPPIEVKPPMEADHYIRPRPGRLALFPSYMWHGTVPFTTDESRMTVAFDIVPA